MAAHPGGYATKIERARRAEIIRHMWSDDRPVAEIAQRVGICAAEVSRQAQQAGLPRRHRRPHEKIS